MKHDLISRKFGYALLLAVTTVAVIRCNSDDSASATDVDNALITGGWKITYYFDDKDETSDFNGYTFTFESNGTAAAAKGGDTTAGTWSTENSSNGTLKLNLDFGTTDPLDELEEDWKVIEMTGNKIRLENISGGSGLTSYVTFERT
jgi:hypothetical protein